MMMEIIIAFMNSECLVFWSETEEREIVILSVWYFASSSMLIAHLPHHDDAPSASVYVYFLLLLSLLP